MHVIINRSALVEVLGIGSGVVASRTTKELLKCVRFAAANDGLLICATDQEVNVRATVHQVEVRVAGEVLVPLDKVMQITRESVDETLELKVEDERCHIRGRDSHFEIYIQDPAEFPAVPDLEGDGDIAIEAAALQTAIDQTIFAVAKENTRYAINGILWEKHGKKLNLVATDGRRLAWASCVPDKMAGDDKRVIAPVKTMSILQRALAAAEGPVVIELRENQILARAGAYVVSSAMVEGHFPQYQDVIPKDADRQVQLNTEEFRSAVRRAALLTNEQSKGIRLRFADNQLVLSSRAPEQGEATVAMPVEFDGPALEIGFSPVFVEDALRVAGTPTVSLEMRDADRPGVIKAGGFLYVVMPVNLA